MAISKRNTSLVERSGNRVKSYLECRDFGFPDRYFCKLKYTDTEQITGTGTTGDMVYRINSLFDPNFTGVGSQPLSFDQLSAVYNKYLVLRCDWEVTATNLNGTGCYVTAVPTDVSVSGSSMQSLSEIKRSVTKALSVSTGGQAQQILRGSVDLADLHGQPNLDADSDQYAQIGTNPQDVAYLTIRAADYTTATSIAVGLRVRLIYYAVFKEYALVNES